MEFRRDESRLARLPNQEINPLPGDEVKDTIHGQDCFMPLANLLRIMRKILPPKTKITQESKLIMQECVTRFISFINSEAINHCQQDERQTLTAEDILQAMNNLGFDKYAEILSMYLIRYRENNNPNRGTLRGQSLIDKVDAPLDYGFMDQYTNLFGAGPTPLNSFENDHNEHGTSRDESSMNREDYEFIDKYFPNLFGVEPAPMNDTSSASLSHGPGHNLNSFGNGHY